MTSLLVTAQLAALLAGDAAAAPAAAPVQMQAPSRRDDTPVRIDFSVGPVFVGDVSIPASPRLFGLTLTTTRQRGPSGPDWGGRGYISVALPRGLGRIELNLGKNSIRDTPSYSYAASPTVLASDRPLPGPSVYVVSGRSHDAHFESLGWSRELWSRGRWVVTGELALRSASVHRYIEEGIEGPEQASDRYDANGYRLSTQLRGPIEKHYRGSRAGVTLSTPLVGAAAFDIGLGCFVARVTETCAACGDYGLDSGEQRRAEALPDLVLRLRIPLGEHVELNGGYRWESWGKDAFDELRWSGRFFAFTFLIGHGAR
jgi:hypothetical protein